MVSESRRAYLREYQKQWMKRRRREWIDQNGPCAKCSSNDQLEVDHKDASQKKFAVCELWSLAPTNPRRVRELAKCWVLCHECHVGKTAENQEYSRGETNGQSKLTEAIVLEIRRLRNMGLTYTEAGARFGISKQAAWEVCNKTWKHVK